MLTLKYLAFMMFHVGKLPCPSDQFTLNDEYVKCLRIHQCRRHSAEVAMVLG